MLTRRSALQAVAVALACSLNGACHDGHHAQPLAAPAELEHHVPAGGGGSSSTESPPDPGALPPRDAGGVAWDGGSAADAGAFASCGNGRVDPGEECDPLVPADSCRTRGFEGGTLGCDERCRTRTSGCSGVEDCYDGRDNDGDGLVDCTDPDCEVRCGDACSAPPLLAQNGRVQGTTRGHGATLAASCSSAAPSGPEVVYRIEIGQAGTLDVSLGSTQPLQLSLRSSCADEASELSCGGQTRLSRQVSAGQTLFVVIDGSQAGDAGEYVLDVRTRQPACGDGVRDPGEACDDGNSDGADGCSATCSLESSETEPNNGRFAADDYDGDPWFAQIGAPGDIDYYRVRISEPSSSLVVRTRDLGDGACRLQLLDSVIDILDTNAHGNALLVSDDDGGEGSCSLAVASGLAPGTYFVRVRAALGASPATFPYRLELSVGACGDGNVTLAEECDDGNQLDGDGCDAQCAREGAP